MSWVDDDNENWYVIDTKEDSKYGEFFYIKPLYGERVDEVLETLDKEKKYWGIVERRDLVHTNFYQIVDIVDNLVGFFALCPWGNNNMELVIACVFIKKPFRNKGFFREIIRFSLLKGKPFAIVTIGALSTNEVAKKIYDDHFEFYRYDNIDDSYWYFVKRNIPLKMLGVEGEELGEKYETDLSKVWVTDVPYNLFVKMPKEERLIFLETIKDSHYTTIKFANRTFAIDDYINEIKNEENRL